MLVAARGLAEIIANRQTQIVKVQGFLDFFRADVLGIPMLVSSSSLVAVVGWILLNRTTFGRRTIAVGGNPEAARLAGINVKRHTMYLYALFGLCCGIAGVMMLGRTTTGSSTNGTLYELDAIAAVVIGGTLLIGGRGTIVGTVLGVLIFTTLTNVFTLNNLSISAQAVAKGVIIVVAVLLQQRIAERSRAENLTVATPDSHPPSHQHRTDQGGSSCPQHVLRPHAGSPPPALDRRPALRARRRRLHVQHPRGRRATTVGSGARRGRAAATTSPATRSSSASRPRRPTTAGWAAITKSAVAEAGEVLRRRAAGRPRAPTTSTCRSARSRRSSTTASTRSCCCRSTARR